MVQFRFVMHCSLVFDEIRNRNPSQTMTVKVHFPDCVRLQQQRVHCGDLAGIKADYYSIVVGTNIEQTRRARAIRTIYIAD